MQAYAQQDRDYDRQLTRSHEDQEQIEYIELQAELIIEHINDKRLCTDHLIDKIKSCVDQMTESLGVIG